jgi:hypothetical protein
MTARQAISHIGAWQVAVALADRQAWGRACRTQAHLTTGATSAAWAALARTRAQHARDVLAGAGITHI